jgi:hypothetical protein
MPSQATRPPLVGMPAVWLRDNCPCPLCRDPVSGQRLLHVTDIPADIAVAEVVPSASTVSVRGCCTPGLVLPTGDAATCRGATPIWTASSRPWRWEIARQRGLPAGRTEYDDS